MKVTIVGGSGVVGSTTAYRLAQDGKVSEIVLVDLRRNLAEAHALDIEQAVVHRSTTRVRAGDANDTKNSDVVLVTASVKKKDVEISRREYLAVNLPLVLGSIAPIKRESPSALWIIASSPVDPLVYLIHQALAIPREKLIGLNRNDTSRFRWAIARTLSLPSTAVEAFVLGEHGETQVPVFSSIRIHGHPVSLTESQKSQVRGEMDGFFVTWNRLQTGRTAGWTSAESVGDIVSTLASQDERVWPCSTRLEGEYGLRGVSIGVPVRLGLGRVQEIVEFALEPAERRALEASAASIKEMIKDGEALLKKTAETDI
jgi:malate/lactate dehydrogenase